MWAGQVEGVAKGVTHRTWWQVRLPQGVPLPPSTRRDGSLEPGTAATKGGERATSLHNWCQSRQPPGAPCPQAALTAQAWQARQRPPRHQPPSPHCQAGCPRWHRLLGCRLRVATAGRPAGWQHTLLPQLALPAEGAALQHWPGSRRQVLPRQMTAHACWSCCAAGSRPAATCLHSEGTGWAWGQHIENARPAAR